MYWCATGVWAAWLTAALLGVTPATREWAGRVLRVGIPVGGILIMSTVAAFALRNGIRAGDRAAMVLSSGAFSTLAAVNLLV